jgi:hypothetical protein
MVLRVARDLGPQDVPVSGDPEHGLFVLETGEIVIATDHNGGQPVKLEFKVDNPGDGLVDYKC